LCRSYVDHSVLSGEALSSGHQCASTHVELSCAPPLHERSFCRRSEPSDCLAEVIRVDRLRSREHVSSVAVAVAVHLGRVRFPCASSAALGNSTERVNGRLALERRSGYSRSSRFSCGIVKIVARTDATLPSISKHSTPRSRRSVTFALPTAIRRCRALGGGYPGGDHKAAHRCDAPLRPRQHGGSLVVQQRPKSCCCLQKTSGNSVATFDFTHRYIIGS
jgi:hypothetical protein